MSKSSQTRDIIPRKGYLFVLNLGLAVLIFACGPSRPLLDLSTVNGPANVSYVQDGDLRISRIHPSTDTDTISLESSGDAVLLPAWSPTGDALAFFAFDDKGVIGEAISDLFASSKEARLGLYERETGKTTELGRFRFSETDSEIRRDNVPYRTFPVHWLHDGSALIVTDRTALYRVGIDGALDTIVVNDDLLASCVAPLASTVAFSDGDSLYIARLGHADAPQIGGITETDKVRALAFSPDGTRLAFADEGDLNIYDISSGNIRKVYGSRHGIYWVDWSVDGTQLYVLKGTRNRRSTMTAGIMGVGVARGHFELHAIPADGSDGTKLYDQLEMDVRDVTPARSPDGTLIALVSREKNERGRLFLIATDGSGIAPFRDVAWCAYPGWVPE